MIFVFDNVHAPLGEPALRAMFEARKRVFVDLLKWDVPVLEGRFELDAFDNEQAVYIVVISSDGAHLGSARLLATMGPHLLDTLFPQLCAGEPPRGPLVMEITRFCLDRRLSSRERLAVRDQLVLALVEYALARGLSAFTGVAEIGWLQQILAFGWDCRPLGLPQVIGGRTLGAIEIWIAPETPALLARAGIIGDASPPPPTRLAA